MHLVMAVEKFPSGIYKIRSLLPETSGGLKIKNYSEMTPVNVNSAAGNDSFNLAGYGD
jgi:hypothetical protein